MQITPGDVALEVLHDGGDIDMAGGDITEAWEEWVKIAEGRENEICSEKCSLFNMFHQKKRGEGWESVAGKRGRSQTRKSLEVTVRVSLDLENSGGH